MELLSEVTELLLNQLILGSNLYNSLYSTFFIVWSLQYQVSPLTSTHMHMHGSTHILM